MRTIHYLYIATSSPKLSFADISVQLYLNWGDQLLTLRIGNAEYSEFLKY